MRRGGPLKRSPRKHRHDAELSAAWFAAVVPRGARCLVCGNSLGLQGHHVLTQQILRHHAEANRLPWDEFQQLLWDPDNGVAICEEDHAAHTSAMRRIPRALLPTRCFVFADRLGLAYRLEAPEYP